MGRNKKKKSEKTVQQSTEDINIESNTMNDEHEESISTTNDREENNESLDSNLKRVHDSENSDTEDGPKKRKKKKKPQASAQPEESATSKKNKKSIRQMKKEKHAARVALEQAQAKDQIKSQCLNYLSQWKHDRQNWKFMKARQVWLHKNIFSTQLIPETSWPILLEYFESAKGNIKTMLLEDASKIIKQMDEWTESQTNQDTKCDNDNEESTATEVVKPDESVYNRARNLLQCLQE